MSDFSTFEAFDTTFSTVPEKVDLNSFEIVQMRYLIRKFFFPFLFGFGIFGNLMTMIIVIRLRAKRSSLDYYFLTLAVCDTCVLFTGPVRVWINIMLSPFDIRTFNGFTCKLSTFTFNAAAGISSWIVLVMTVQRALSVVWPHRVGLMCTAKRMWGIIAGVVIFLFLVYSQFWYGKIKKGSKCTYIPSYYDFLVGVFVKIDVFLFSVIPVVGLMISNVVLVTKLRVSVKEAGEQFAASDKQQSQREQKVNSITLTALVMSVSFIVFTFPIAVWNSMKFMTVTIVDRSMEQRAFDYFLQGLLYTLFYFNFSINFYLYCLTGKRFRDEFKRALFGLVRCLRSS